MNKASHAQYVTNARRRTRYAHTQFVSYGLHADGALFWRLQVEHVDGGAKNIMSRRSSNFDSQRSAIAVERNRVAVVQLELRPHGASTLVDECAIG